VERELNTRGELLALWSLFFFSLHKKVFFLHLVGDSKLIVDWFSYKNNLQVIFIRALDEQNSSNEWKIP
jgi:hypothetical protein